MPKRIENLREHLLQHAAQLLREQGYDALAIRRVAAACNVAVGTVYNYFPSKDMLAANVMLRDWMQALDDMRRESGAAESALEGLRAVYAAIAAFAKRYAGAWAQYAARADAAALVQARHQQLLGQLCDIIRPLLERFNCLFHPSLTEFLAQTLLSASLEPGARFDDLSPILQKLLD